MNWFKKLSRKSKFFLFSSPLLILIAGGVLFVSTKQFLFKENCGCGPPAAEATGEYEQTSEVAIFNNQPVDYQFAELIEEEKPVLGVASDERWIEIDLSDQKLYAHEGDRIVYEFLVSSGKWAPTPEGDFRIWIKLRYTKMSGGSKSNNTYYYLPNVPYTQYFYKGFGLHGTYWHNNFGHPMSHGCVNLATPDAEKLFYWTSPSVPQGEGIVYPSKDNPGTRVIIHS